MRPELASRRFRTSRAFALLGYDELTPAKQRAFAARTTDREFFGLLTPLDPLLPAKAVSKEIALFLFSLQSAKSSPALLASTFGDDETALLALLADGVMEVEHDGVFVSGTEAVRLFAPDRPDPAAHAIARLSSAAIDFAAAYVDLDAAALVTKVYLFGREPCTPSVRSRFAKDADLLAYVTDGSDTDVAALLASLWTMSEQDDDGAWISWSTRRATPRLGHKLYVSARLGAMPPLFAMAIRAFAKVGCESFKIGRRGEGVCRPDKLVAYFPSLEQLRHCASLVETNILDAAMDESFAQGVPFTAPIDVAGFLSWGMDPPELDDPGSSTRMQTWRQWIAARVAVAVVSAKAGGATTALAPRVMDRLALDGIDTSTWVPTQSIWRKHAAHTREGT